MSSRFFSRRDDEEVCKPFCCLLFRLFMRIHTFMVCWTAAFGVEQIFAIGRSFDHWKEYRRVEFLRTFISTLNSNKGNLITFCKDDIMNCTVYAPPDTRRKFCKRKSATRKVKKKFYVVLIVFFSCFFTTIYGFNNLIFPLY